MREIPCPRLCRLRGEKPSWWGAPRQNQGFSQAAIFDKLGTDYCEASTQKKGNSMTEEFKSGKIWEKPKLSRLDAANAEVFTVAGVDAVRLS